MAKLSRSGVLKLARLARLELTDDEIDKFQNEINEILSYVEQLQNVQIDNTLPTYQVTGLKDVMRPDEPKDYSASSHDLLKNAPATENGHIRVRRIIT